MRDRHVYISLYAALTALFAYTSLKVLFDGAYWFSGNVHAIAYWAEGNPERSGQVLMFLTALIFYFGFETMKASNGMAMAAFKKMLEYCKVEK